jgi:D-ribose pyranose/furanose isomerase RbsD
MIGIYDVGIVIPSYWKKVMVNDVDKFKESWNKIYSKMDFSTVVMSHGTPVSKPNVKEDVTKALQKFLSK